MPIDPQDKHRCIVIIPDSFVVECPSCHERMGVDPSEQEDCSYDFALEDKFIECRSCDKLIELVGIKALEPLKPLDA